jgi:hypothetical protein
MASTVGWRVRDSKAPEIRRFADSITADLSAVRVAFESPWSSERVEGQINRLKFLKRQMYGRAKLDLLRAGHCIQTDVFLRHTKCVRSTFPSLHGGAHPQELDALPDHVRVCRASASRNDRKVAIRVWVRRRTVMRRELGLCRLCDVSMTHSGKGIHHMKSETQGSQYFLRFAVNKKPELLRSALQESGALGRGEDVEWCSPLIKGKYKEFRDGAAVEALGCKNEIHAPLAHFWPSRGPVWDALGTSGEQRPILIEAKAHIAEAVSRISASSDSSIKLIGKSLALARKRYTQKSHAD